MKLSTRVRILGAVLALAGALPLACSRETAQEHDAATGRGPDASVRISPTTEPSEETLDASADATLDGEPVVDAAPDVDAEAALRSRYRVVLHLGDSEVGFGGGLTLALRKRFAAHKIKFVTNSLTSAGLQSYDAEPRVSHLVKAVGPDLVIINLGTNNLSMPYPASLIGNIKSIVKKISVGGRECVWVGPPHLAAAAKREAAMDAVLRENVAPCRYFESMHLKLELQKDHIHPNDRGGEVWASQLFRFIVFNEPPSGPFLDEDAGASR